MWWSISNIDPRARYTVVKMPRRTKEETSMDIVKVCDDRHILGQTDKAIQVRIGQTLYGEPITTFYPKSMCQIRPKIGGGYEVFVPKWVNRDRKCKVGDFDAPVQPGFCPLPF